VAFILNVAFGVVVVVMGITSLFESFFLGKVFCLDRGLFSELWDVI